MGFPPHTNPTLYFASGSWKELTASSLDVEEEMELDVTRNQMKIDSH